MNAQQYIASLATLDISKLEAAEFDAACELLGPEKLQSLSRECHAAYRVYHALREEVMQMQVVFKDAELHRALMRICMPAFSGLHQWDNLDEIKNRTKFLTILKLTTLRRHQPN